MNLALIQDGYLPAIVPPILRRDYVSLLERVHRDKRDFKEFIAEREFGSQKEMLRLFQIPFPREGQERFTVSSYFFKVISRVAFYIYVEQSAVQNTGKGQGFMEILRKKDKPAEKKKKAVPVILLAAGISVIAAGAAIFFWIRAGSDERQTGMPPARDNPGEGIISASGLTAAGMLDETWELDFLQTALYVEEIYLSAGDEVEAGTAVFKVSDGTLEEARKELEDAVTETELAYRQGVLDYEAGIIDARVENENAAVNKKYSQAEYNSASAEAAKNVKELEKQAEEARELAEEYTKSVNEDYYRAYYKVDELYQAYYEHFSLLMETYEKWDIENKKSLYGNSVPDLGGSAGNSSLGVSAGSSSLGVDAGFRAAESSGRAVFQASASGTGSAYIAGNLVLTGGNYTYGHEGMLGSGNMYDRILVSNGSDETVPKEGSQGEAGKAAPESGSGTGGRETEEESMKGEEKSSGEGEKVPGTEERASGEAERVPETIPEEEKRVPETEEKAPGEEETLPGTEEKVPEGDGSTPETGEDNIPSESNGDMRPEGFGQEGPMPDRAMDSGAMGGGYSESETLLAVYNLLDEMVKQEAEEYETALENYEKARRTAQAGLEKAQSDLASLEAELVTARTEYEKQLIACRSDYEITLAQSDNAQAVYEVTLESLEETLASLESGKEEAAENLALFEDVIGDGYFYTQSAGTIVMNGVRKGSYLSGESLIIAYSDPEKVSVTASVDQSDIAEIAIGDKVYVVISEYGNYQGTVTMLNPVAQAQSRSSVTYQVTVTLEGDVSALDSNLTAYVYFGMPDEMMQEMQNMPQEMPRMPQEEGKSMQGNGGSVPERGNRPGETGMEDDTEAAGRRQAGGNERQEDMPQTGENERQEDERQAGGNERQEDMPRTGENERQEDVPQTGDNAHSGNVGKGDGQ